MFFPPRALCGSLLVRLSACCAWWPWAWFGACVVELAGLCNAGCGLRLMFGTSLLTSGVLALLSSMGWLSIWHLGVGCFINGICWAADNPVRRMMIGDSVGAQRIGPALSVDVGVNNISRVLGLLLAGLTLGLFCMCGWVWVGLGRHRVCFRSLSLFASARRS